MPTTPIILVLGLLAATCVIAYWADNLGKKLGKKRISLFGLRPRQTATLISMVSSVGIMLFTLIVLLVFSDSVRNALLHYDTVRANLNRVEARNLSLQKQNEATLRDMQAMEDERAALSRQVTAADTELARANEQVERTRALINRAQTQLKQTQSRLQNVRQRLTATEKSRNQAQASERQARTAAAWARQSETQARSAEREARGRFETAENRYDIAQTKFSEAQEKLRETAKVLNETNKRLEQVNQQIEQQRARLVEVELNLQSAESNQEAAEKRFVAAHKELEARQTEVQRLQDVQAKLTQEISLAEFRLAKAEEEIRFVERILIEPIVIEARTVFAANTLPSRLSVAQTRAALHQLVREARTTVENLTPPRRLEISARIEDTSIFFSEQELIEQLANYLAQIPIPTSVRIIAARDHIQADETVAGRFEVVPVRVIYPRGSTLASATIDGKQGDALIFRGLLRLTDIGAAEARRRGAVPLVTRQDEPFFAEGTNERIFTTLRRIGELDKPVLVRLVADEDLTTIAPLRVRFDLADAPDNAGAAAADEDSNSDAESS